MMGNLVRARLSLADTLDDLGLAELLESVPGPYRTPQGYRAVLSGHVTPALRNVLRLLVFGQQVAEKDLPAKVVGGLEEVTRAGFCVATEGRLRLTGLTLTRIDGLWYLSEFPFPGQALYFGPDSCALINRLTFCRGRALDLCSGPGIIGLILALRGAEVTAVEINPVSLELSRVNASLNGLIDTYEPRLGDLYAAVSHEERFDLVVANPPLVPIPQGFDLSFAADGGDDGMRVTWRLLEGLDQVLTDDGVAQTLGATLSSAGRLMCLDRLEAVAAQHRLDIQVTITGRSGLLPEEPWCRVVASDIIGGSHVDTSRSALIGDLSKKLHSGYVRDGADQLAFYYLRVRRGRPRVSVHDLVSYSSLQSVAGGWYVTPMAGWN
jgi:release factor glutamine methyltransferase